MAQETPEIEEKTPKKAFSGGGFFGNIVNRIKDNFNKGTVQGLIGPGLKVGAASLAGGVVFASKTTSSLLSTSSPKVGALSLKASAVVAKTAGTIGGVLSSSAVIGAATFLGPMGLLTHMAITGENPFKTVKRHLGIVGKGLRKGTKAVSEFALGSAVDLTARAAGTATKFVGNLGGGVINAFTGLFSKKVFTDISFKGNETTNENLDKGKENNIKTQKKEVVKTPEQIQAEEDKAEKKQAEVEKVEEVKAETEKQKNFKENVDDLDKTIKNISNRVDDYKKDTGTIPDDSIFKPGGRHEITDATKQNNAKSLLDQFKSSLGTIKGELVEENTKKRLFRKNKKELSVKSFGFERSLNKLRQVVIDLKKNGGSKNFSSTINIDYGQLVSSMSSLVELDNKYKNTDGGGNEGEGTNEGKVINFQDKLKEMEEKQKQEDLKQKAIDNYDEKKRLFEKKEKKTKKAFKHSEKIFDETYKKVITNVGSPFGLNRGGFVFDCPIVADPVHLPAGTPGLTKIKRGLKILKGLGTTYKKTLDGFNVNSIKNTIEDYVDIIDDESTDNNLKLLIGEVSDELVGYADDYYNAKKNLERMTKPEGYDELAA